MSALKIFLFTRCLRYAAHNICKDKHTPVRTFSKGNLKENVQWSRGKYIIDVGNVQTGEW